MGRDNIRPTNKCWILRRYATNKLEIAGGRKLDQKKSAQAIANGVAASILCLAIGITVAIWSKFIGEPAFWKIVLLAVLYCVVGTLVMFSIGLIRGVQVQKFLRPVSIFVYAITGEIAIWFVPGNYELAIFGVYSSFCILSIVLIAAYDYKILKQERVNYS